MGIQAWHLGGCCWGSTRSFQSCAKALCPLGRGASTRTQLHSNPAPLPLPAAKHAAGEAAQRAEELAGAAKERASEAAEAAKEKVMEPACPAALMLDLGACCQRDVGAGGAAFSGSILW